MVRGAGEEREGVWVAKRGMLMLLRRTEGVDPGELDEAAWRKIETAYIYLSCASCTWHHPANWVSGFVEL
jgi:hypothetical protein